MFLRELIIENNGSVIREIAFHKGINFIVDETPEIANKQSTGNNVGKTTVLRLVDYCLGGSGKNIYSDTEFGKQPNTKVEKFLKENNIIITVVLVPNLEDDNTEEIVIRKNFLTYKNKIQEINGERITNDKEFDQKLKQLIFKSNIEKPTFKQIISKNIRDEKNKLTNIVKVLDAYTKPEEYEALYLFWLGLEFEDLNKKYQLLQEKSTEERLQKRLILENSLSLVEQSLIFTNNLIEELNNKKNDFNLNENYDEELKQFNDIKTQLNKDSTELGRLEIRRDLILESKEDLQKQVSDIDTTQIKSLYEKAKSFIPDIQASFEDTLRFHNDMIVEKIEFITKELPQIERTIILLKLNISKNLGTENILSEKLQKPLVDTNLREVVLELNKAYEKKGTLEEQKRLWKSSNEKLTFIDKELDTINSDIISKDPLIQSRIAEFNKFFSSISHQLYGEYYLLSSQTNNKGYELIITNFEGNPSTGKKKGQIAAFDFAYIQFADALNIECLHFIMHDQIENIHDNQINTLVEVSNKINGQYIVPILRDKIPANIDVSAYEVLSLSQNDKLFRIE